MNNHLLTPGIPERLTFYSKVLLALILLSFEFFAISCKPAASAKPPDVDYYTCTMHPSVRKENPTDKCPICGMSLVPVKKKSGVTSAPATDADYYTCTMHPSVKKHDPNDKCPICSMSLTPVKRKIGGTNRTDEAHLQQSNQGTNSVGKTGAPEESKPTEFTVTVERQQQIGVTYATVEKRQFKSSIRAVGLVASDRKKHWDYVSRVEGYVKELFVFSRGELVEKGEPLLTIYSPDLLTTEDEFIQVLRMRDEANLKTNQMVSESTELLYKSAKQRLHLWNISDDQIANLEKTRKSEELLTLHSPFKGVVQDVGVDQGRKVMNGDHLVDIADLSLVWVWAQFYQDELPMLKKGLPVAISSSSYPGEMLEGKISVIDPFINDAMRTGRVRIDVDNPDFRLQPDMYVDVDLTTDASEGIAVPVPSVLPTGRHNIVFVDKGEGKLEPRFIDLGRKYGDYYEVKHGLKEKERVVSSANFLIDAEAKVQGALKSF
jgi:Cu(I)/Ag(I) efflux system membrane fusion protein